MNANLSDSSRSKGSAEDPNIIDLYEGKPLGDETLFMPPNPDQTVAGFLTPANIAGIDSEREPIAELIKPKVAQCLERHQCVLPDSELLALSKCIANSIPFAEVLPMVYSLDSEKEGFVQVSLLIGEGTVVIPESAITDLSEVTKVTFELQHKNE